MNLPMAKCIVRTPGTCGGQARLEGTRIPTEMLAARFAEGESVIAIAADYEGIDEADVEAAIRYELHKRWKRRA